MKKYLIVQANGVETEIFADSANDARVTANRNGLFCIANVFVHNGHRWIQA